MPDISQENNYKENFASAFANNQFGRKQTRDSKGLQIGEIENWRACLAKRLTRHTSEASADCSSRRRNTARGLARHTSCWQKNEWRSAGFTCPLPRQTDIVAIRTAMLESFQPPAIVMVPIRIEPVFLVPRTRISSPMATISLNISLRLPAIVISSTGY